MKRQILLLVQAWAFVLISASTLMADDTECVGFLGPVVVDNVVVPSGADCYMNSTQVLGNVKVEPNASLTALFIRVEGNLHADRHRYVQMFRQGPFLTRNFVRGNVTIEKGGFVYVADTDIGGNWQVLQNTGSGSL